MLKSSGAMGVATLTSRILGMVREVLYARFMGDGFVAAAFTMAFMIPNLFRRLLGEGALTAAFIPIFKEKEVTEGEKEMWHSANAVISGMLIAATVIIGIAMLIISVLLATNSTPSAALLSTNQMILESAKPAIFQPGWLDQESRLMLALLRVMFPYMLLVCLAAIFIGMLNARGHFFAPAMAAVVLNLVMIAVVLWLAPRFGHDLQTQIFALAIGVLIAGVGQAIYLFPTLRREGFRYRWVSPWKNETVQLVVRKMIPGTLGVAAFQLNVLITQGIAWSADPQIVASFGYAVRLMELPQGVFGISLATFLLPTLSGLASAKKYPEFRATLGQGVGYLIFANLIASVFLIVLAEPIIRLLFERGEFTALSTRRASFALACLAPGLVAFSLVNILARAFYALGDTQTPMKISVVCLGVNIVLTFWLVRIFAQGGLGIANSLSAGCNVWLLFYALRRKLKFLDLARLKRQVLSMAGGAVLAGEVVWILSGLWENHVGQGTMAGKLGAVFVPMTIGYLIYALVLFWLKVPQVHDFMGFITQKLSRFRK